MLLCWLWRWLGAKECREHSPGRNIMETKLPSRDSAENSPLTPWLQLSETGCRLLASRTIRQYTCVVLSHQVCDYLLQQQYNTKGKLIQRRKKVGCKYSYSWILWFVFHWGCRKSFCWVTFYVKDDFHINKGIILSCLNDSGISVKKSTLTYFKLILSIFFSYKTSTWSLHKLDKETKTNSSESKLSGLPWAFSHHYLGWQTHMETGLSTFSFQHVTIHSINSEQEKEGKDGFLPSLAHLHLAWGQVSWKSNAPWEIILFSLGPQGIQAAQWSPCSLLHAGDWIGLSGLRGE